MKSKNTPGRLRVLRLYGIAALITLSVVAVSFLLISPPIPGRPPKGSNLQIEVLAPEHVESSTIRLRGFVEGAGNATAIRLSVNGVPIDETWTRVEPGNPRQAFSFDEVHLRSGENTAEILGVAIKDWRRLEGYADVPLDNSSPHLENEDSSNLPGKTRDAFVSRKTTLRVSYNRIDISLVATLPRSDGRVKALMTGQKSLPPFIQAVFGDFLIQGNPLAHEFRNVTPDYDFTNQSVTVSASTDPERHRSNVSLTRALTIHPDWREEENDRDEFVLNVSDYKVQAFDPPPEVASREGAKWNGSQQDLISKQVPDIKVQLAFQPQSARAILGLLRLTPYEALPTSLYSVVGLIQGFLVTIPFLWALLLLARFPKFLSKYPSFKLAFVSLSRTLIAFAFAPHVFYGTNTIASLVYKRIGLLRQDNPRLLLIIAIAIIAAGTLALFLSRFIRNASLRLWLRSTFRGIRDAAMIYLASLMVVFFALKIFPYNLIHLAQFTALLIALFSILLLGEQVVRVLFHQPNNENERLNKWWALAIFATLIVISSVLAYPSQPGGLFLSFIVNLHNESLEDVREFFFLLINLLPYLLFLGIVLLLRKIELDTKYNQKVVWGFGALIFAGFVVGSSSTLFMIPIPFFLAVWFFRYYIVAKQTDDLFEIDRLRAGIWKDRRGALQTYYSTQKLSKLRQTVETLQNNRLAGTISDSDYKALKVEVEERIATCEKDARLADDIVIKDVVLGIGPMQTNWQNAKWTVQRGTVVALVFASIYLWGLLQRDIWPPRPHYLLGIVSPLLAYFLYWLVCAFFFGYFYVYFRGNSGLRKGAVVGASIVLCLLPVWLLSITAPLPIFLRAGQTFVFFACLGLLADYQILKAAMGASFEWKKLVQFEEIRSFATFATVVLTGLGTSIQTAIAGHGDVVLRNLVELAFQQLPKIPPLL